MEYAADGDLSGRRLRQAREARGYTKLRRPAASGVSHQFISGREAGRYWASADTLQELAAALGVSYMELAVLAG